MSTKITLIAAVILLAALIVGFSFVPAARVGTQSASAVALENVPLMDSSRAALSLNSSAAASLPRATISESLDASVYSAMDAQLRDNLSPPSWFYTDRDMYAEVAELDPKASISEVKCGESFCRVVVQHENGAARRQVANRGSQVQQLADELQLAAKSGPREVASGLRGGANVPVSRAPSIGSTTIYHYPADNPTQTFLYVMRMDSQEAIPRILEAKMIK